MNQSGASVEQVATDPAYFSAAREGIAALMSNIKRVIIIQKEKLEYIIASRLAGGHVILADSHGVGKTSLARALAGSISWEKDEVTAEGVAMDHFNRVQCTVDLLPQDIIGFNRYEMNVGEAVFNRGPMFAHFVLCDEINLLTPKTQGSFLQAMEEGAVTVEGRTYKLPDPFFIIATMNLKGSHLFPLPAPQLDRFMIQISLGYPAMEDEVAIIQKHGQEDSWKDFSSVVSVSELVAWQKLVDSVSIHEDVLNYIVRLVRKTRSYPGVVTGASPRSGIKISRLARALALVRGLDYVSVDMVKELIIPALAHRMELEDPTQFAPDILNKVMAEVKVKI